MGTLQWRQNRKLQLTLLNWRISVSAIKALLRLACAVLVEQHVEWVAADRRYFSEQPMTLITANSNENEAHLTPPPNS